MISFLNVGAILAIGGALALLAAPASAQERTITLSLNPAEALAVQSALDKQPISEIAADGFWSFQAKLSEAVSANPDVAREINSLLKKRAGPVSK